MLLFRCNFFWFVLLIYLLNITHARKIIQKRFMQISLLLELLSSMMRVGYISYKFGNNAPLKLMFSNSFFKERLKLKHATLEVILSFSWQPEICLCSTSSVVPKACRQPSVVVHTLGICFSILSPWIRSPICLVCNMDWVQSAAKLFEHLRYFA